MPRNNTGLRVNISGDADELQRELTRAQKQIQGFAGGIQRIDRNTKSLNRNFVGLASSVRAFGVVLAATVGAQASRGLLSLSTSLIQARRQLELVATEAGDTVGNVRALQTAFVALGSQADIRDTLIDGIDRISEALTITSSEAALAADALERFGFDVENLRGRKGVDLILALSTELQKAQAVADRLGQTGAFRNQFETLAGDAEKFAPLLETSFQEVTRRALALQEQYKLTNEEAREFFNIHVQAAQLSALFDAALTKTLAQNADEISRILKETSDLLPTFARLLNIVVDLVDWFARVGPQASAAGSGVIGLVTAISQLLDLDTGRRFGASDLPEELRTLLRDIQAALGLRRTADNDFELGALIGGVRGMRMQEEALEDLSEQQETTTATTRDLAAEFRKLQATSQARLGFDNITAALRSEILRVSTLEAARSQSTLYIEQRRASILEKIRKLEIDILIFAGAGSEERANIAREQQKGLESHLKGTALSFEQTVYAARYNAILREQIALKLEEENIGREIAALDEQIAAAKKAEQGEREVELTRERDVLKENLRLFKEYSDERIVLVGQVAAENERAAQLENNRIAQLTRTLSGVTTLNIEADQSEAIRRAEARLELSKELTNEGRRRVRITQELEEALIQQLKVVERRVEIAKLELENAKSIKGLSAEQLAIYQRQLDVAVKNREAIKEAVEAQKESRKENTEAIIDLDREADLYDELKGVIDDTSNAFADFAASAVTGFESIEDAARRLGQTILSAILNRLLRFGIDEGLTLLGIPGGASGAGIPLGDGDIPPLGPSGAQGGAQALRTQFLGQGSGAGGSARAVLAALASVSSELRQLRGDIQRSEGRGETIVIANTEIGPEERAIIADETARQVERGIAQRLGRNNPLDRRIYQAVQSKRLLGAGGG